MEYIVDPSRMPLHAAEGPAAADREAASPTVSSGVRGVPMLDPNGWVVFPNHLRTVRRECGYPTLRAFEARLNRGGTAISYMRLAKIERGEVLPTADELKRLASVLSVDPASLVIDRNDPAFDLDAWVQDHGGRKPAGRLGDVEAVLLGAAVRYIRESKRLSIRQLKQDYSLPAIMLSRIEHAEKPVDRWRDNVVQSLCRLFGVASLEQVRANVSELAAARKLDKALAHLTDPERRRTRLDRKLQDLGAALMADSDAAGTAAPVIRQTGEAALPTTSPDRPSAGPQVGNAEAMTAGTGARSAGAVDPLRRTIKGRALGGGLISLEDTAEGIALPPIGGPRSYVLRLCRATLGPALSSRALLVVDPDAFVKVGGLAVVPQEGGVRAVYVGQTRAGALLGYSVVPETVIDLEALDPASLSAVVAVLLD